MSWFRIDDGFYDHPKAADVSNAAIGLWARAGSYCSRYLTDGAVSRTFVRSWGTTKQAAELVKAGLWTEDADGWRFHDWTQSNPTRAEVEERRAEDAERKREARKSRSNRRERPTGNPSDVRPDGGEDSARTPQGLRPDVQPDNSQTSDRSPRARARVPDPTRPVVPTGLPTDDTAFGVFPGVAQARTKGPKDDA